MRFTHAVVFATAIFALVASGCGPTDPQPTPDELSVVKIHSVGPVSATEIPSWVLTNTAFVIEFNQNVDPTTVTPESISLTAADEFGNDIGVVAASVPQLYGDRYVLVAPVAELTGQSYYNFHVTAGVMSETGLSAVALKQTFKTATTGDQIFHPTVSSYQTPNGTNVVACGDEITVKFSLAIDPRTLDEGSVVVTRDSDNAAVGYTVEYHATSAVIRPSSSWEAGKSFTIALDKNRIANLWGNKLLTGGAGVTYQFSTHQNCQEKL